MQGQNATIGEKKEGKKKKVGNRHLLYISTAKKIEVSL